MNEIEATDECVHQLQTAWCAICASKARFGERVVVSESGHAFHRNDSCSALRGGQNGADNNGFDVNEPKRVFLSTALNEVRQPCLVCYPTTNLKARARTQPIPDLAKVPLTVRKMDACKEAAVSHNTTQLELNWDS